MMPLRFWPLMRTPEELGLLDGLNCTPGNNATKLAKWRLDDGRLLSSSSATLPPTCAETRSTCGDSPVTVTDSSTAPIRSVSSTCTVGPTTRTMFSVMSSRKPGSRAVSVYGPGGRLAREYSPSGPATVSRNVPVSSCVATIVVPGSTPPCSSTTTPRIADVPCATASAVAAHASPRTKQPTTMIRMHAPPRGRRCRRPRRFAWPRRQPRRAAFRRARRPRIGLAPGLARAFAIAVTLRPFRAAKCIQGSWQNLYTKEDCSKYRWTA